MHCQRQFKIKQKTKMATHNHDCPQNPQSEDTEIGNQPYHINNENIQVLQHTCTDR